MAFDTKTLHPLPSHAALREAFVGKILKDVPTPAAVVDKCVVQRNCLQMLKACGALQVGFRPHVKTHKAGTLPHIRGFIFSIHPLGSLIFSICALLYVGSARQLVNFNSLELVYLWLFRNLHCLYQRQFR